MPGGCRVCLSLFNWRLCASAVLTSIDRWRVDASRRLSSGYKNNSVCAGCVHGVCLSLFSTRAGSK